MVASAHDDGDAQSVMADGCCGLAQRAGKEKGKANGAASASGRRAGCSCHGQQRQEARGAWQHAQATGDARHTRVGCFLKLVSHCSIHSDEENRLTALFQRVNTANLLHLCKNGVYEKCRSTIHLQFLFKDHSLIRHGSAVK